TWFRCLLAQRRMAKMIMADGDVESAIDGKVASVATVAEAAGEMVVQDGGDLRRNYCDEVRAVYRRLKQLRNEQKDLKAILRVSDSCKINWFSLKCSSIVSVKIF
ncbi:hypothetical protein Tcan_01834, partial [Toxocara canis]